MPEDEASPSEPAPQSTPPGSSGPSSSGATASSGPGSASPSGPAAGSGPDATQLQPPARPTTGQPDDDATAVVPKAGGPSGTSVMPAVSDTPAGDAAPRWSARAQVRPAGVEEEPGPGWEYEEGGPPGRGLFGPILLSLGAVLFLVLVVAAVLLMMRDAGQPTPVPSATATLTAGPTVSPTSAATTAPPTTTTGAPPTTSFGPAPIEIPALAGQGFDQAATQLRNLGLQVRRLDQTNPTVPAGQVIETDPPAGTLVVAGFRVDVIVSTGPAQPPTTTTTTAPPN
jgi:hypothetical protein